MRTKEGRQGTEKNFRALCIGISAGGWKTLHYMFQELPGSFPVPIFVVQHQSKKAGDYLVHSLDKKSALSIQEAGNRVQGKPNCVYIGPPDYHILIENDLSITLSTEAPVNFARPSIDVLFESAAYALGPTLLAILLTGASKDGADGLKIVKQRGGTTIVQSPASATATRMPNSALEIMRPDYICDLEQIPMKLVELIGSTCDR